MELKKTLKKIWHFIWEEDSVWSWIVNIVLAFLLIKFIIYPGLGLALGTHYPIVAVVSESMEHKEIKYDTWWVSRGDWYVQNSISKEEFSKFPLKNGFNRGDIMILKGKKAQDLKVGDVIVFKTGRPDPIIHRIVEIRKDKDKYTFHTKGDNNAGSLPEELAIQETQVIGTAKVRVPLLGWIKISFVELFGIGGR